MDLTEKMDELHRIYDSELSKGPFPYRDVESLEGDDLVPDLDLYFSEIAGIASHGKRLLRISEDRKKEFMRILSKSFFDKHPEFLPLKSQINAKNVPSLSSLLESTERARLLAIEALREI